MLQDPKALRVNKAYLQAWDPVNQKEVWRVPSSMAGRGAQAARCRRRAGSCSRAIRSANEFAAYRAETGEQLWVARRADGRARGTVDVRAGWRAVRRRRRGLSRRSGNYWAPNYSRVLVYKLGGTATVARSGAGAAASAEPAAACSARRRRSRTVRNCTDGSAAPAMATMA